jgi:hypothetical protein
MDVSNAIQQPAMRYSKLLALGDEIVFAYSRISGDGRFLVYSSEPSSPRPTRRVLRVHDLETHKVIYQDDGIDGYWSPDGTRLVYSAQRGDYFHPAVWDRRTRQLTLDITSPSLGDYYSWGFDAAGNDVIFTILGWYGFLRNGRLTQVKRIGECDGIGMGLRPLLSRDARFVTAFSQNELVLRSLADCTRIIHTGLAGAKADWSADSRYVAFHAAKANEQGYDIVVFDSSSRQSRRLDFPNASGYFPSWTDDGALVFRYDGDDFKGFVRADGVLNAPISSAASPLPRIQPDGLKESAKAYPSTRWVAVMFWASWGAHSASALKDLSDAQAHLCKNCSVVAAYDPTSDSADVAKATRGLQLTVRKASWPAFVNTGALNQTPSYVLLDNGCIVDRVLGAMTAEQVSEWIHGFADGNRTVKKTTECGGP